MIKIYKTIIIQKCTNFCFFVHFLLKEYKSKIIEKENTYFNLYFWIIMIKLLLVVIHEA